MLKKPQVYRDLMNFDGAECDQTSAQAILATKRLLYSNMLSLKAKCNRRNRMARICTACTALALNKHTDAS